MDEMKEEAVFFFFFTAHSMFMYKQNNCSWKQFS